MKQKYHSLELLVMLDGGYLVTDRAGPDRARLFLFAGGIDSCLNYIRGHIAEPNPLREMSTTGAIS